MGNHRKESNINLRQPRKNKNYSTHTRRHTHTHSNSTNAHIKHLGWSSSGRQKVECWVDRITEIYYLTDTEVQFWKMKKTAENI